MAGIPVDWDRTRGRDRAWPSRRRASNLFGRKASQAWKHVDLVLVTSAGVITALGCLMILSSTRGTDPDAYDTSFLQRQLTFAAIGVVGMVLLTLVDYRRLRDFAWLPYVIVLVTLALVVSPLGIERRGAQA